MIYFVDILKRKMLGFDEKFNSRLQVFNNPPPVFNSKKGKFNSTWI
ncbi:hypothetical protein B4064_3671 [Caldibacillus thermoamylovorans]|nr:hypothetical protein B4064_3671 [Caldibacillus thermoamylovorans]KIO64807.1 hypothetical protein B4065_2718 [Caldibacillus thermoamylovorans]